MNENRDDIAKAMAALRKALEKRMRQSERAEQARVTKPARSGQRASYDMAALGRRLRPMLEFDGRGWAAISAEIGVTSPDLSRVMAGQDIAVHKVFAICDWSGLDPRKFYRPARGAPPPRKRPRPCGRAVRPPRLFHGKSTETKDGEKCCPT